jgi:hypothetical protein
MINFDRNGKTFQHIIAELAIAEAVALILGNGVRSHLHFCGIEIHKANKVAKWVKEAAVNHVPSLILQLIETIE